MSEALTAEQAIDYLQSKLGGDKIYRKSVEERKNSHPSLMWTSGDLILRGEFLVGAQEYQFRVCKSQPRLSPKKRVPQADYIGKSFRLGTDEISGFVEQYKSTDTLVQAIAGT